MKRKILMIYPEIPATYWSLKYALPFVGYKTLMPPLGLITVAAMLPSNYDVRLIDLNYQTVTHEDIMNANMVFVSAMIVQKDSFHKVVRMCNNCGVPVAAGGPYPTNSYKSIRGVDHFILNEGEITLPKFIRDLEDGRPQKMYRDETKPDITKTPVPRFDLLDLSAYASMALQSSRGCPFNCEFCDIIEMFGRVPRYKLPEQFVNEMDVLYRAGYRGPLFIVDDNFIGNKKKVRELLTHVIQWQKANNYPFPLYTEASINLAQDDQLMDLMVEAGMDMVFIGIETPVQETLELTQKQQNTKADILESVQTIQSRGMEVMGGFIIGFDSDPENIFDLQIDFIQKAGIPLAMIGTMIALPNTQLYRRLEREGRILGESDGNNTHSMEINFIPRMPITTLMEGYKQVIATIYQPKRYFERCIRLIRRMPGTNVIDSSISGSDIRAFLRSLGLQIFSRYGFYYLKLLGSALLHNPKKFSLAVNLAIKGYHFFKMTDDILTAERVSAYMKSSLKHLEEEYEAKFGSEGKIAFTPVERPARRAIVNMRRLYRRLNPELKEYLKESYFDFKLKCETTAYMWSDRSSADIGDGDALMNAG
ncbi:MAG: B12-binding domain-containing radical SAM protein [Spirochaetes bacterium]|nr:B12-binding domain-containing radical SAM protein [Spirochaetota bacterium]